MSTTPTPRTDAEIHEEDAGYNGIVSVVSPDFARQLERELKQATADLASMAEKAERYRLAALAGDSAKIDLARVTAERERWIDLYKGRNKTATALENASPDLRARIAELETQLAREIEARNGWWDHCKVAEQRVAELVAALRDARGALNYSLGELHECDRLKRKVEVTRDAVSAALAHAESATPVILDEAAVTAAYVRSKTPTATPAMWVGAPYDCPHCGSRHNPGPCDNLSVTQAATASPSSATPAMMRDRLECKGTDYKATPAKHPDTVIVDAENARAACVGIKVEGEE